MTTIELLDKETKKVENLLKEKLDKNLAVGAQEAAGVALIAVGEDVSDITDAEDVREKFSEIPVEKKGWIVGALEKYHTFYENAIQKVREGSFELLKKLPEELSNDLKDGARIGLKTGKLAKGMFPELCATAGGFLVGADIVNENVIDAASLVKGIVSKDDDKLDVTSVRLAICAGLGAISYVGGKFVAKSIKKTKEVVEETGKMMNYKRNTGLAMEI